MRLRNLAIPLVAAAFALSPPSQAGTDSTTLAKEARVTESQARETALRKVPHGTIKSFELEKESGRLVRSFDISQPSVPGVTEVHVDAKTGKVIEIKKESPAQEARESKAARTHSK